LGLEGAGIPIPAPTKGSLWKHGMLVLQDYGRNTCLKKSLSNTPKVYYDYKYGLKLKLF
jgi:hypothetical protein